MDTLKHAESLTNAGVPRSQAETHVKVWAQMANENLASKQDINAVQQDMGHLAKDLRTEMSNLAKDLRTEMSNLAKDLRTEMSNLAKDLRAEVDNTKNEILVRMEKMGREIIKDLGILILVGIFGVLGCFAALYYQAQQQNQQMIAAILTLAKK